MSRPTVIEQAAVTFGASHETVAKAIMWTLFMLAQHPDVLSELGDELDGTLGDAPPTLDELQELPLLDAITKESMRLFPPVPMVLRKVRADSELAGMPLRRHDFVLLSHYDTHRCPKIYSHPQQFLPKRWFDWKPDNYAYVPFSAGPRACIGMSLGTAMINLVVAMIVQRFRFCMVPNSRVSRTLRVTLAPKYGLPMLVLPKNTKTKAAPVRGNVHEMVDLTQCSATKNLPVNSQRRAA